MLYSLDMFTGIGGFHLAAKKNGCITTLFTSEIDSFNCKLIEQNMNLENAGDIVNTCIPSINHPHSVLAAQDTVPVEETGFSSLCLEDFFEGVLPFPDMITGGFPCQNVSSANLHDDSGIDGEMSSLVAEQLRIMEDLEIPIAVFENAEALNSKGLDRILIELNRMGYIVEWETISATAFNYPHYRHRVYIVAYRTETIIAQKNVRIFDSVRQTALYNLEKPFKIPLLHEDPTWVLDKAVALKPREIKLRTKRINGLGNAVLPDIPLSIFNAITFYQSKRVEDCPYTPVHFESTESVTMRLTQGAKEQYWTDKSKNRVTKMPTRGVMYQGAIMCSAPRCELLNPSKTFYKGLYSTLIRKDGNNNFTTKSRLNRPGKLGGLVGEIMQLGANEGGLHPHFCERFMGYEKDHTLLEQFK